MPNEKINILCPPYSPTLRVAELKNDEKRVARITCVFDF